MKGLVYTVDDDFNVKCLDSYGQDLTTVKEYDEAGRLVSETNPDQETTRYTYDSRGNLVVTREPMGQT